MDIFAKDLVPFTYALTHLSELADEVKAGAEKIFTKDGERYVALIDAARLDYYHVLERELIHLILLEDARRGFEDIDAGRVADASGAIAKHRRRFRATQMEVVR